MLVFALVSCDDTVETSVPPTESTAESVVSEDASEVSQSASAESEEVSDTSEEVSEGETSNLFSLSDEEARKAFYEILEKMELMNSITYIDPPISDNGTREGVKIPLETKYEILDEVSMGVMYETYSKVTDERFRSREDLEKLLCSFCKYEKILKWFDGFFLDAYYKDNGDTSFYMVPGIVERDGALYVHRDCSACSGGALFTSPKYRDDITIVVTGENSFTARFETFGEQEQTYYFTRSDDGQWYLVDAETGRLKKQ